MRPMGKGRQYATPDYYERKLAKVMERLGVEDWNYNWDRYQCWVQFRYKGELYRFDHSIERARQAGINLVYGSDVFAQVVLALEDLVRMVERGIYDLPRWVAGMKYLPPVTELPSFIRALGFTEMPSSVQEVRDRYRALAKQLHPDKGGSADDFAALQQAAEKAIQYLEAGSGR